MGEAGHGIWADNDGTGAVTITSAAVTGMGTDSDGIYANLGNVSASANLSITASGTVTGGDDGIFAYSGGTGAIAITTAAVTGTASDGIYAGLGNEAGSGDISVTASGAVSGGTSGISATNAGSGTTSITAASVSAPPETLFALLRRVATSRLAALIRCLAPVVTVSSLNQVAALSQFKASESVLKAMI